MQSTFYDNLKNICEQKGVSISSVLNAVGRSSGNTGSWKAGKLPKIDIVVDLAEYLGISLDELVYGQDKTSITQNNEYVLDPEWIDIISHIPEDRQQMCKDFLRTHMSIPSKYADSKRA